MFEEETPCFDPTNNLNSIPEAPEDHEVMGFPQMMSNGGATFAGDDNMADLEPHHHHHHQTLTSFEEEHDTTAHHHYTNIDHAAAHLIQEMIIGQDNHPNNIGLFQNDVVIQDGQPTQDLLNLFHLPPPQFDPPIQFLPDHHHANNNTTTVMFDPLFHLNAQLTPHHHHSAASPLMRELFQSLPHGCFTGGDSPANTTTLFGSCDDINGEGLMMFPHHHDHEDGSDAAGRNKFEGSGVFDFGCRDMPAVVMGKRRERKGAKHYPTDREKRCQMNDRFSALKNLIPNPTKTDRASIVGDAISYIQELIRSVKELELLVSRKRCGKRARTEGPSVSSGEMESCVTKTTPDDMADQSSYNSSTLRTSWLQRKSKVTEVDVRIIDDEVTIKLVQRKKINCLLYVSRVLDELQLDLHHVAGGQIGEHHSFLFNSKIDEGSSVYASAIASKLMEAVDAQYAMGNQVGNF